jgi:hypothetical protein
VSHGKSTTKPLSNVFFIEAGTKSVLGLHTTIQTFFQFKPASNLNGVNIMQCTLCQSVNLAEFTAEMMIHFSGLRNIDHPGLPAVPKVLVCLNCGSSHFTVPATKLALLASRTVPVGGRVESPAFRVA